ncbi:zinc knuckle CX2CX4HX4C containing protein [Tanacetum coccineum]|uniref:Zinc knuckle CX2CX4HX4C containing protein n=1 Tax=Tanacetum coccineum TaxID=301880 RepID=A0ABQ4X0U8_9ASTR
MIRKSPIILKKWSMCTSLLKEELTRIPIWVKLHDVPLQVFEEDEAGLVDVVTIGILSLTGDDFTKETIRVEYEWRPPRCAECKIFGHVHDHCPKKVVSPHIVSTSNVVAPAVEKSNDGFQTATPSAPKKGATNVSNPSKSSSMLKTADSSPKKDNFTTSNSFSALNEVEDNEEVENVHDESANLFKTGGSSSFTAAAG